MTLPWRQQRLNGWGRTTTVSATVAEPRTDAEVEEAILAGDSVIAYGNGRSYGDAALLVRGRTISMARLDRVLSFDETTGDIVCESGVMFRHLLRDYLPRGFLVPVTPGTAFATIGGAVANDVHGKNHDRRGSFGDHVRWLDLMVASGEVLRVSPDENSELFAATVAGIGLTGIILRVAFRMDRVASSFMQIREQRIPDLETYLAAFASHRSDADFSVGWIDGLARGGSLGRGILETACIAGDGGHAATAGQGVRIPFDLPGAAMNAKLVTAFNEVYFRRIPKAGRTRRASMGKFFYPLDALRDWNRIYGRRGFYQFQCVIPDSEAPAGLRRLLETVSAAGRGSFLAVLKTLGSEGRGCLSFPIRGHTLALDLPRRPGVEELIGQLERITLDHGGRIYLAKDALLSREGFRRMYPLLDRFVEIVDRWDPKMQFNSEMALRLGIRSV